MEYSRNKTKGAVDHVWLSEIADLALTHGRNESAGLPEDRSLSHWYERERGLSSLLPAEADLALTHGRKRDDHPLHA